MADIQLQLPRSSITGNIWPAVPDNKASAMLAIQAQFESSQWWSESDLARHQYQQLSILLTHSFKHVPYYKECLTKAGYTPGIEPIDEIWAQLPVLTREQVQEAGDGLVCSNIPTAHGKLTKQQTSGSTGRPVTVIRTGVSQHFWYAATLRDHLWHQRDFSAKFCAIRPEGTLEPGRYARLPGWGHAVDTVYQSSPSLVMNSRTDIATQAKWLAQQDPVYLLSMPSNLIALARYFDKQGLPLPSLKEVRSYGEIATGELRQVCREVWDVPVKDMYSATEVGYIALQCPEHEHYHVQSETIMLEVLDEQGQACKQGETGRIVVTPLHNFAMPLIRYALGDYAEVGEPCACGLPVLKKILGRQRNMLILPDGRQHWPSFPAELWTDITPIRQIQLVQKDRETIEARIVAERKLKSEEVKKFSRMLQQRFGYPFVISINYVDAVKRSPSGKFEDFVSEVSVS